MDKASIVWVLQHFDYAKALELYLASGHASKVKAMVLQQRSPHHERVLREELQRIAALDAVPEKAVHVEKIADFYTLPHELQALIARRNELRKDNDFDFIRMVNVPEDENCPELSQAIVRRHKEITSLQEVIDYFYTHGKMPERKEPVKPKVDSLSQAELLKRRNTLRTYISRTKDEARRKAFADELAKIEELLKNAVAA